MRPAPWMDRSIASRGLVVLLRLAYSGELAAGFAYRGHWKSVRDPEERRGIREIEEDEWKHRGCVGEMLRALGAGPSRLREARMWITGRLIGLACHVGGWFVPMYGAGRLEAGNVVEYEVAARLALCAGRGELVEELLHMAEVEWDHEQYFREKAASHVLWRWFPRWTQPPPRAEIRTSFAAFAAFAAEHEHGARLRA